MSEPTPPVDPNATPPAPAGDLWYKDAGPEVTGYLQNRNLHDKTPAEVALAAIKSHREAEAFIGAPANQLLRVPTEASDEAGWNAVWSRLGVPSDAAQYDLSSVKFADGTAAPDDFLSFARNLALEAKLPAATAARVAQAIVKYTEDQTAAEATERTATLQAQRQALAANWGANYAGNLLIAQNAAKALGVAPEAVDALESVIGYDKVMEMLRTVGTKIGEDRFISNAGGTNLPGIVTRDQALEQKQQLMNDAAFRDRFLKGDAEAVRRLQNLDALIVGQQAA